MRGRTIYTFACFFPLEIGLCNYKQLPDGDGEIEWTSTAFVQEVLQFGQNETERAVTQNSLVLFCPPMHTAECTIPKQDC